MIHISLHNKQHFALLVRKAIFFSGTNTQQTRMDDKDVLFRPIILKRNINKGCGFVSVSDTSLGQETWNTIAKQPQQRKVGHFKNQYVNLVFFHISILNLKIKNK